MSVKVKSVKCGKVFQMSEEKAEMFKGREICYDCRSKNGNGKNGSATVRKRRYKISGPAKMQGRLYFGRKEF